MTLIEIIKDYLDKNGFDGLYDHELKCQCLKDELCKCDNPGPFSCKPGYLHKGGHIHEEKEIKCKHCEFLDSVFKPIFEMEDKTNREYWIYTEMFVYLHNGKDVCDIRYKKESEE